MTAPLTMPALLEARRYDSFGRELLVADEVRLTYDALDTRSVQFACELLGAGVGFGMRIGIMLPNTAEFVVTFAAITRIGAVAVPISTLSTAVELRRSSRGLCALGRPNAVSGRGTRIHRISEACPPVRTDLRSTRCRTRRTPTS